MIPIERFLDPEETNVGQLRTYAQALLSGSVQPRRSPLPYLIAVHHVNRFIYTTDGAHDQLKQGIMGQVLASKNQVGYLK